MVGSLQDLPVFVGVVFIIGGKQLHEFEINSQIAHINQSMFFIIITFNV
jgi:hypothetical protein